MTAPPPESIMHQSTDWIVESGEAGHGRLRHLAAPGFTAFWASGDEALASIDGPCWSAAGSGGSEDAIHIFALRWDGPTPDRERFALLMDQAAAAIDRWIAARL